MKINIVRTGIGTFFLRQDRHAFQIRPELPMFYGFDALSPGKLEEKGREIRD
jgi:hypothetical protein